MKTQNFFLTAVIVLSSFMAGSNLAQASTFKVKDLPMPNEFLAEEEQPLEIEEWMANEAYWTLGTTEGQEKQLSIEPWMTDEELWKAKPAINQELIDQEEPDHSLKIESWMIDEQLWCSKTASETRAKF